MCSKETAAFSVQRFILNSALIKLNSTCFLVLILTLSLTLPSACLTKELRVRPSLSVLLNIFMSSVGLDLVPRYPSPTHGYPDPQMLSPIVGPPYPWFLIHGLKQPRIVLLCIYWKKKICKSVDPHNSDQYSSMVNCTSCPESIWRRCSFWFRLPRSYPVIDLVSLVLGHFVAAQTDSFL